MRIGALLLAVSLTLFGCAVDEGAADDGLTDDGDALTQVPTLTFNTDGTVTQSAPLMAGGNVRIKYSQSRIRQCTGNVNGIPGWAITGFASLAGAAATSWDTGRVSGSTRVSINQVIALPRSGELALWFQQTNRWGCQAWDSRAGMNYRFAVALPAGGVTPPVNTGGPTLTFQPDGSVTQTGTLAVGQRLRVRYAQERIAACGGTIMGNAAWSITGYASLNGGARLAFDTGVAAPGGTRTSIEASVELTASGDLALWFAKTSRWGCVAWDSRSGQNYHFSVALR